MFYQILTFKNYKAIIYKDPIDGGWESKPEEIEITEQFFKKNDKYQIVLIANDGVKSKVTDRGFVRIFSNY